MSCDHAPVLPRVAHAAPGQAYPHHVNTSADGTQRLWCHMPRKQFERLVAMHMMWVAGGGCMGAVCCGLDACRAVLDLWKLCMHAMCLSPLPLSRNMVPDAILSLSPTSVCIPTPACSCSVDMQQKRSEMQRLSTMLPDEDAFVRAGLHIEPAD